MRVLYDASLVGTVHGTQGSRAGIFRVVDTLLRLLMAQRECEVELCAAHSAWALFNTIAYVHEHEALRRAPFGCKTPFDRSIPMRHELAELEKKEDLGITGRIRRSALYRIMKRVEGEVGEGDYSDYASHDVYHSPFFPLPDVAVTGRIRRFLTVYDLIPLLFPRFYAKLSDQIEVLSRVVDSIGPDDRVFAISHCTKRDLCERRADLNPERVIVTQLAASDLFYPHKDACAAADARARYSIPDAPYILSVATLEPRKNLRHVIRSFAAWVQQDRVADVNLVLVGEKGWGYEEILAEVSHHTELRDRILITGRVRDDDLAAIYSGALAFAYLSFYEGFGLPPLEAMQCGAPVISSNRSSLPEVVGDAGILLDPDDADGLCAAFGKLWGDGQLRETMGAQSVARAGEFSWKRCLFETIAGYRTAMA
jgi:glycosyltransferase involved in cell wall biosynthesis